jgi:T-complex protein 1 subunit alpha
MAGIQGPGALQLMGERTSGQDVRTANVMAVAAVANIVKSSLGPVGLDKVGVVESVKLMKREHY